MNKKKHFWLIVIFILLTFISIGVRAWWGAASEWKLAQEEMAKGEFRWAIMHYEKVILWRFPWGGYTDHAVHSLQQLTLHPDPLVRTYAQHALTFALSAQQRGKGASPLPDSVWSLILGLSLVGWIGTIVLLIFLGFSRDLKLKKKNGASLSVLFLFLFLVWVYSLGRL